LVSSTATCAASSQPFSALPTTSIIFATWTIIRK
jgi:hypothetical protein